MKLAWPNPVLVFSGKSGSLFQFRSLHNVVLVQETVNRISVQQMAEMRDMNQRFNDKLMAYPFIVLDTGDGATAFSPNGASCPVDIEALPLLDIDAPIDEGIILVSCSSLMTVYGQRDDGPFRMRMHDIVMSSVMCMPRVLDECDIPFLVERRRLYAEKQLDNSRLVLQSGRCISLYGTRDFSLLKTLSSSTS